MTSAKGISRRDFVKQASAAATAALGAPWIVPSTALGGPGRTGANDRIRVGVIGTGVRGKYLIANLPESAQVVSLCDCSLERIGSVRKPRGEFVQPLARFAAAQAGKCSTHQDYRRMLEREKLDAVIIAAPDHHHAQAAILACQARMDVYVEKPLAVTIAEGRAIVTAAKKHDRVVQVGSQQRTMQVNRFACEFIRKGGLGKVSLVQLRNYPGPMRYENLPAEPVPKSLAWELFCGPTELRPHNWKLWIKDDRKVGKLLWRGWDLWREYSGHIMTNWGAHHVDMVQYALGMDESGPVEIWPEPELLKPSLADAWIAKTPPLGSYMHGLEDRMRFCPVAMKYANGTTMRFDPTVKETVFHGERGKLHLSRNDYWTEPNDLAPPPDAEQQQLWSGAGHVARPHLQNWLDAVRARTEPNAPIEVGHRTATVCHLANLARELRRRLQWDPVKERFVGDDAANRLLSRPRRKGFELPVG